MICIDCGYENVDVHSTPDEVITYCQNCSKSARSKNVSRKVSVIKPAKKVPPMKSGPAKRTHLRRVG